MALLSKTVNPQLLNGLAIFAAFVLVVTVIVLGQPILMPIGLAILLSFILTPVVRSLERLGLGRVASVCVLVATGAACLAALLIMAAVQVNDLIANLPTYWDQSKTYVDNYVGKDSFFSKAWEQFKGSVDPTAEQVAANDNSPAAGKTDVVGAGTSWLTSVPAMLGSIFGPLATTIAILVLTIFMLIFREDIRNRFIGALGESHLMNTTRVMNDTSERLSNYLFGLFSVNLGFSIVLTIGLFALGVPYAIVWGVVSFFFRFIPYLGSTLSMLLPLIASIVSQQSWFAAIGVVVLYSLLEFSTGNFIEPNLFGNSVGMNPVALLIALMFWAWAWGTIGLAMAVPLSLIIVTLGRHLPCFQALETLAGNSEPLPPHSILYQRLLSGDLEESRKILDARVSEKSLSHAVEDILLQALAMTRSEFRAQRITAQNRELIERNALQLIEDMTNEESAATSKAAGGEDKKVELKRHHAVRFCRGAVVASSNPAAVIGAMTATSSTQQIAWDLLENDHTASLRELLEKSPKIVLVAGAAPDGIAPLLKACRRLRRLGYTEKLIVGYWRKRPLSTQSKDMLKAAGADYYSHRIWTISRLLVHLDDAENDEVDDVPPQVESTDSNGTNRLAHV